MSRAKIPRDKRSRISKPHQEGDRSPAVALAEAFLRRGIEGLKDQGNLRLPALRLLAKQADVSLVSMWKAAQKLQAEGVLSGGPRRGLRIGSTPTIPNLVGVEADSFGNRTVTLSSHLEKDLLLGHIAREGVIPPPSELSRRYGGSLPTWRKILKQWEVEKRLVVHGKIRRLIQHTIGIDSTVVLIGLADANQEFWFYSAWLSQSVQALEAACMQARVRLQLVAIDPRNPGQALQKIMAIPAVLGHIIWLGDWVQNLGLSSNVIGLIQKLARLSGRPISVFDEQGSFVMPREKNSVSRIAVFRSGAKVGEDVGAMLASKGHHHVAYISPFHQEVWSQRRLQGLKSYYRNSDLGENAIQAFVRSGPTRHIDFAFFIANNNASEYLEIHAALSNLQLAKESWKEFQHVVSQPWLQASDLKTLKPFRKGYSLLSTGVKQGVPLGVMAGYRGVLAEAAGFAGLQAFCRPLFKAALGQKKVTAWVLANDITALAAQEFLKEAKVEIGKNLSVVGYDNTQESHYHNLTSYDFDIPSFAHRMLNHVLLTASHSTRQQVLMEEIPGWIALRKSVRQLKTTLSNKER